MRSFPHRKLRGLAFLLAALAAGAPLAVPQSILPSEPLRLFVDFTRRRGDEKEMFIEVYYAIPQRSLTYKSSDEGFKAGVVVTLIAMKKDSMVYGDRWPVRHVIKDSTGIRPGAKVVDVRSFGLPEGEYILKMFAKDENNPLRKDSVMIRLPVKMVGQEVMTLSDLELAWSIRQRGNKASPFYKNTLEVEPAPEGLYGENHKCFYYAEAYNLLSSGEHGDYVVKTVVWDAVGREIVSRERLRKRVAESTVIIDSLAVDQLKTGTYSLIVGLLDSAGKVVSSKGKKFFVYNQKLGIDSSLVGSTRSASFSEYAGIEEPELDKEFDIARYEATDAEKVQYKALRGADPKRRFLVDFWAKRPLGFKEEYLKRVAYVNATYGMLGRRGYQTDRGRVYIVYGPPDDYERHPNESELKPYEIWTYNNIQGGVIFVFLQRTSTGDFELVHSTHRSELHDENWMQYAQPR